jgi:hypothetical protein
MEGFVNVDAFAECKPDVVFDLETTPWPWKTSSVTEVVFNHSLEHMGGDPKVFLAIMRELYRICAHDAVIQIHVPHPRHDNFMNDPTHVRAITPEMLRLFSKQFNEECKINGSSDSPFGFYLNIDFELVDIMQIIVEPYHSLFNDGSLSREQLLEIIRERNNIVIENRIKLRAIKK